MRLAGLALVVLLGAGCSSGSTSAPSTEDAAPESSADPGTTVPGTVVAAADVVCVLAPRTQFGAIMGVADAPAVACTATHNHETFALPDSVDLDDCYRAAAASSDLQLGTSSFGDGELDFDDDRLVGHLFGTAEKQGIECSIDLRDDRTGALIGSRAE